MSVPRVPLRSKIPLSISPPTLPTPINCPLGQLDATTNTNKSYDGTNQFALTSVFENMYINCNISLTYFLKLFLALNYVKD